jgi:multicomponent K+:H+ antiporter subunit E
LKRVAQRAAKHVPPVLTITLVAMWLLLNQTLAFGQVALGAVLALALVYASATLRPLQPRLRRPYLAAGLLLLVLKDIVQSNIDVARIVLGLVRNREVRSGFVVIPLDIRDPHGLAVLAAIVTSTPGTVWVDLANDSSALTLHVLDLQDEKKLIDWIKGRYERRLMRIFE